ncbi:MAG: hypothetical protein KDH96_12105, partial [Candidatus Riesia sp.]|nr:hypothetical protein [Candidatus Riesia sp.]
MELKFRDWIVHPIKSFKKQQAYVRQLEDYAMASKPAMSFATGATDGVNIPYFDGVWRELEDISLYSDLLRTVHLSLKSEIFRNGFDKENIDADTEISSADEATWNKFVCRANSSGQTLRNVFGQIEDDTNVFDDRYLMAVKEYTYYENMIYGSTVKEF